MPKTYYVVFISLVCLSLGYAQEQVGFAAVRPLAHQGMMTQSNVLFSHDSLVASHRSIPLGKIVKVTNLNNMKFVVLKINDRGPYIKSRIIDLSQRAAVNMGIKQNDVVEVRLEILDDETLLPTETYPMPEEVSYSDSSAVYNTEVVDNETVIPDDNQTQKKVKESKTIDKTIVETSTRITALENTDKENVVASMPKQTEDYVDVKKQEAEKTTTLAETENAVVKDENKDTVTGAQTIATQKLEKKTESEIEPTDHTEPKAQENTFTEAVSSTEKQEQSTETKSLEEKEEEQISVIEEKSQLAEISIPTSPIENDEPLDKAYSIQIGSFSERENAYAYSDKLLKTYNIYNIKVKREDRDDSYKVVVGRFTEVEFAQDYKNQLVNDVAIFEDNSILIVDEGSNIIPSNIKRDPFPHEDNNTSSVSESNKVDPKEAGTQTETEQPTDIAEESAEKETKPDVPEEKNAPSQEAEALVDETKEIVTPKDDIKEETSTENEKEIRENLNEVQKDSIPPTSVEGTKVDIKTVEESLEAETPVQEVLTETEKEKTEGSLEKPVSVETGEIEKYNTDVSVEKVTTKKPEPAKQQPTESADIRTTSAIKEDIYTKASDSILTPVAEKNNVIDKEIPEKEKEEVKITKNQSDNPEVKTPKNKKGRFTIQVGTFKDKEEAVAYSEELLENYKIYNLKVRNDLNADVDEYKVVVGRFTERQYAQTYKDQLVNNVDIFNENSILVLDHSLNKTNENSTETKVNKGIITAETENAVVEPSTKPADETIEETQIIASKDESQEEIKIKDDVEEKKELFTIQVGTFDNKDNAEAYSKELLEKHKIFNLKTQSYKKDNATEYRVIVGRFTKREYAQVYKEQLDSKIESASIIPLED